MSDIYLLNSGWSVWQNYKSEQSKTRQSFQSTLVLTFRNLHQFALLWNTSPLSDLSNFFLCDSRKINKWEIGQQLVEVNTVSVFREGIEPKWEHPANSKGASFSLVINDSAEDLQRIYQQTILLLISQRLSFSNNICGVRFIDKYVGSKGLKMKLDIWINSQGKGNRISSLKELQSVMSGLGVREQIQFKQHQS